MQFTLLQHGEDINADHHIRVLIRKDQWQNWYDEMMRRFKRVNELKSINEPFNAHFIKTYDVDECQECGVIGIEHLSELLKFLANE